MTTETEPMVRVIETVCEGCEFRHNAETCPDEWLAEDGWGHEPVPLSEVRRTFSSPAYCEACGWHTGTLIATEPVR